MRELTSFVGREAELARLSALIDGGNRLITLLGPPGIGKTRVASRFLMGCSAQGRPTAFCDLRGVETIEALCLTLGQALGVQLGASPTSTELIEQIGRALASHGPLVVVLDNFEQLVLADPLPLSDWLMSAPAVVFVVTSRRLLRLGVEKPFELDPLPTPLSPDEWECDAVRLFVERATSAEPRFRAHDCENGTVQALVRQLEGLPLAIELAACAMRRETPAQLLSRLEGTVLTLECCERDRDPRHRTLRRAIAGTWNALTGREQEVLSQLAGFRGGFTEDAACQVVTDPSAQASFGADGSVGSIIARLRDSSLLYAVPGQVRRWDSYEAIWEFVREEGRVSGSRRAALQRRHANYFRTYHQPCLAAPGRLLGPDERQRLSQDRANLQAAYAYARDKKNDALAELALPLALGLVEYAPQQAVDVIAYALEAEAKGLEWPLLLLRARAERQLGRFAEARQHLDRASTGLETGGRWISQAEIDLELGYLEYCSGEIESARAHFSQAIRLSGQLGQPILEGAARFALGWVLAEACLDSTAFESYARAKHCFEVAGDPDRVSEVRGAESAHQLAFQREVSQQVFLRQRMTAQRSGDRVSEARAWAGLGLFAFERGALDDAVDSFQRAIRLCAAVGLAREESFYWFRLGMALEEQRNGCEALQAYRRGQTLAKTIGERRAEAFGDVFLASPRMTDGSAQAARAHLASVGRWWESKGDLGIAWAAQLQQCRCELVEAQRASREGRARRAKSLRKSAESRQVRAFAEDRRDRFNSAVRSDAARFLLRLYRQERDQPLVLPSLRVPSACDRFQLEGRTAVSLASSPVARRCLKALVTARREHPGIDVPVDVLLAAGWPGQSFHGDSGTVRVKNVVRRLRRSGLDGVLLTGEAGYRIDPGLSLESTE